MLTWTWADFLDPPQRCALDSSLYPEDTLALFKVHRILGCSGRCQSGGLTMKAHVGRSRRERSVIPVVNIQVGKAWSLEKATRTKKREVDGKNYTSRTLAGSARKCSVITVSLPPKSISTSLKATLSKSTKTNGNTNLIPQRTYMPIRPIRPG